jgi:hypothetical protein
MHAESASVARRAASVLRPPNLVLSWENKGHVVKQRIAAHSAAERKGSKIKAHANPTSAVAPTPIHCSI